MTDGIIQKVFKNFKLDNGHDHSRMGFNIEKLQQELIKEIKKKLSHKTSDMCEYQDLSLHRIVDILIGDKND